MFSIIGVFLAVLVIGVQIHTGTAWMWSDKEHTISRKDTPGQFWFTIAIETLVGIVAVVCAIQKFGFG